MQSYDHDYWDWLGTELESCGLDETLKYMQRYILTTIAATIYSCIAGLILCSMYYLYRRKSEDSLHDWLNGKGKYLIFLIFCCSFSSFVSLAVLTNDFIYYYTQSSASICDNYYGFNLAVTIGSFVISCFCLV